MPLATRLVDARGRAIARIVHELVLAYDVELVVIGGGISRAGAPLLDRILAGLARIAAPSAFAAELLAETDVRLAAARSRHRDIGARSPCWIRSRRRWSHAKPWVDGPAKDAGRGRVRIRGHPSGHEWNRGGEHRCT